MIRFTVSHGGASNVGARKWRRWQSSVLNGSRRPENVLAGCAALARLPQQGMAKRDQNSPSQDRRDCVASVGGNNRRRHGEVLLRSGSNPKEKLPRRGVPMILREIRTRNGVAFKPYSYSGFEKIVQTMRKAIGDLPAHFTLDACRHGGYHRLGGSGAHRRSRPRLSASTAARRLAPGSRSSARTPVSHEMALGPTNIHFDKQNAKARLQFPPDS